MVALFDRVPHLTVPRVNEIAVKVQQDPTDIDLRIEGRLMRQIAKYNETVHIVRLIRKVSRINPQDIVNDGLSANSLGVFGRLLMEYCPLGTLYDQIERRITAYVSRVAAFSIRRPC